MDIKELKQHAAWLRIWALKAIAAAGSGHPGGSLSLADIMTVLYDLKMHVNPQDPKWENRDRLVLSKGHAAPIWYAALAHKSFFKPEELLKLRHLGAMLQGHPDMKHTPGVDMTSGSLGQGISAACGMALAAKLKQQSYRVYAILGDGETDEGQVWEALMFAHQYKLNNLTIILDYNRLQIDGPIHDVMDIDNPADRFKSFHLNTIEIDGHDFNQIIQALDAAEQSSEPTAIVAHTVKGKGVSFMEDQVGWHGKAPSAADLKLAVAELEKDLNA